MALSRQPLSLLPTTLLPAALLLVSAPVMAERVGVLVLDASGSMWNRMDGDITRIEVARDVIDEYLHDRDPQLPLSMLAYGHNRRGDCGDIEVIAAMSLQDADSLAEQVRALNPQGMTPIAESLRLAAEQIPLTAEAADIILVTDGLETCGGDPCDVAARLAEQGLAIRAHVVGFGLSDDEIQQLSCVTEQTGGELFQTHSGAELAGALSRVEEVAAEPEPEPEPESEPEPQPAEATLNVPAEIPAGSEFEVSWEGPDDKRDYITIVPAGAPEDAYESYQRTGRGSPLSLTAPDALGEHEVRYIHNDTKRVLASQTVTLTPISAALQAPEEISAGSEFEVDWEGPDNPRDYITIVPADAPEDAYESYQRTSRGTPLSLTAPDALGSYEVRYVVQQSKRVLASQPVTLTPVSAHVKAPEEIPAGSEFTIEWEGPDNPRDYITIVPAGAPEDAYESYQRTSRGSPLSLTAPDALGNYEVRYVVQQSRRVLASQPVTLTPVTASLLVRDPILPGGEFEVKWQGPDNPRDYITIVPAGAPEDAYESYQRTNRGSPLTLAAPEAPGDYEVRYVIQQSRRVLASEPVSVGAGEVSLAVEGNAEAGSVVNVAWQGPGRYEDFIQIVAADAPDDAEAIREARASQGSPLQMFAPASAGEYELRYRASDSGEILGRQQFQVK
ncbi:vWA domain-containing protein [Halomonas alimentaria]|uniref:VWA domain-containing protein n=1 Tax=Halomonas alimentaria TaxID=147248 RepID=A0A7X5ANM5_9GAMM|nr:VWA domain-containing protein [Halomonas alimentaria]NAW33454.1 VWA domain-containing protein [Halomonas alimentaria]